MQEKREGDGKVRGRQGRERGRKKKERKKERKKEDGSENVGDCREKEADGWMEGEKEEWETRVALNRRRDKRGNKAAELVNRHTA